MQTLTECICVRTHSAAVQSGHIKFKLKVNFVIYITDRKAIYYLYIGKAFLLRCVNLAALPLVRCYSIHLPRRVAIAK